MRTTLPSGVARLLIALTATAAIHSFNVAALSSDPSAILRMLVLDPQWSLFTHLLVFFVIFFGLLVKPLKDKLNRAGVAVAIGIALMLSASLALSAKFHLLDFGPLAGIGIFVLLGAVCGLVFRRLYDASWASTAALSYVIAFGSIKLVMPDLVATVEDFLIVPAFLYACSLVWLIYAFASQAFPTGNPASSWFSHATRTLSARPPQARQRLQKESEAQRVLSDTVNLDAQDHAQLLAEIEETQRVLKKSSTANPELRAVISGRLQQIAQAQRKCEAEYGRYMALAQNVETLDASEYADLKQVMAELPDDIQTEARAELAALKQKLSIDNVIKNLGMAVQANNVAVRAALDQAGAELSAGHIKACQQALNESRSAAAESARLSLQITRFTDQLKGAAAKVIAGAETRAGETALAH